MKTKVSIIIPIFNGEKYIKRCLDNINNQTLKNLEIIIVNDASTDNTKNILLNLNKSLYKNAIKVITLKQNKGVSNARNIGLKYSIGEYIQFIDVDDTIEKNALKIVYNKCKNLNLDICIFNYNEIINNKTLPSKYKYENKLLKHENLIKHFLVDKISPSIWDKLFKKNFLIENNLKFDKDLNICEDLLFVLNSFIKSSKVYTINNYFYNYYQNVNSSIHTLSPKILQVLTIHKKINLYHFNLLNNEYKVEFGFFKFYLIVRTIHSICLATNPLNKPQAYKYLKKIFIKDRKLLLNQMSNQFSSVFLVCDILIFSTLGYKIYVFLFPLLKKIRVLKNNLSKCFYGRI